ncbi:MAG: class I mannose-6-phosphate isomerase [Muribaculaceae bacterium]|nr:class I mannose-6-phosphate isomerase [Muribaculaceae bacterium]
MIEKKALIFTPYLKSVIWGGSKICSLKGIPQPAEKIGESWEISAIPSHLSIVADGRYKGLNINELIDRFGADILGTKVAEKYHGAFPLLIKLIDAADDLSVQVHPDDDLAMARHCTLGKSEMWYIIDADADARIYAGLNCRMTPDGYVQRVQEGTFASAVASHPSAPGYIFFLPAGRVHAIGAGNFVAEIQQSSDITYRIYDYDRRDADGHTRQLHADLAKDAIDYNVYSDYTNISLPPEQDDAPIVSCDQFATRRIKLNGTHTITLDGSTFVVVMCIEGAVTISAPDGDITITAGHTALVPAAVGEAILSGNALLLTAQI